MTPPFLKVDFTRKAESKRGMSALPPHPTVFTCEKQPATGSRGMIVTNHPLASAAGAEMLLCGGNAVDAAVAALFALTVVEPMMVGLLGGGISHLRLPDGQHRIIDGLSTAPASATPAMYAPLASGLPSARETEGRRNSIGALAVAVPGALAAWCHMLARHGTRALPEVMAPAIRLAENGFTVTPYLADCVRDCTGDLARDAGLAALFLPGGGPIDAGLTLVQTDYARTLRQIATEGPETLYGGALGQTVAAALQKAGGLVTQADLAGYAPLERQPVRSSYRGHTIIGPPPPASSGVHIAQMLNLLEGFDVRSMGFGTPDTMHLMAEAMKIAFADRAVATADPAFVKVPVERLISKAYADKRRGLIDPARTQAWSPGVASGESADTTHVTVADAEGCVVSTTQTINGLFGACLQVEGTGMLANNYMLNFDPHPGRALSIAPGKRVFTSMAPMMIAQDGKVLHALGLPGGLRIFPSAFQAIINLIDHGMDTQDAVEAPRLWTEGAALELEQAFTDETAAALARRGHAISRVNRIAGGMNAISFQPDGTMTGAACWRADGTPVGIAGGLARAGVRFSIA
jgi:gamma-glutamyltranspeptidase / glutathione hydrolase